uniref:Uncharacterized protein n=1 Tax=Triticum urartu TaxID=4572 RepID=A0A8R7TXH4_TRIUA
MAKRGISFNADYAKSERRIEVANGVEAEVAAVSDISLELADGFKLLLRDVLYVPS